VPQDAAPWPGKERIMITCGSRILTTLLAAATALASQASWADKPVSYTNDPVRIEDVPIIYCGDFGLGDYWVMISWTYNEYGRLFFNKAGALERLEGFSFLTERSAYNSSDPAKAMTEDDLVGSPEHSHFTVHFDEAGTPVYYKEVGISFKATIPGSGSLAINAGQVASVSEDGFNWTIIRLTPNWNGSIEEAYALCSYLQ
jgi:hypothetical protein